MFLGHPLDRVFVNSNTIVSYFYLVQTKVLLKTRESLDSNASVYDLGILALVELFLDFLPVLSKQ